MKQGKILLLALIVVVSAVGLFTFQEWGSVDEPSVINDFFSNVKTVKVSLSDGAGTKLSGNK
jgi:hypothetical protein